MKYKYPLSLRMFHWLIFFVFIGMYSVAYIMQDMDPSPEKWQLYGFHKATGVLLLFIILARIYVRFRNQIPEYAIPLKKTHKIASHTNFKLLYVAMILMPVSGIVMSLMGGHPINMFLFTIPALSSGETEIGNFFYQTHVWTSIILILLVSLHILGAIFHLFIEKNNLLRRII